MGTAGAQSPAVTSPSYFVALRLGGTVGRVQSRRGVTCRSVSHPTPTPRTLHRQKDTEGGRQPRSQGITTDKIAVRQRRQLARHRPAIPGRALVDDERLRYSIASKREARNPAATAPPRLARSFAGARVSIPAESVLARE